jgi:predicted lipoprotein with Yx(FWY)xxD motif
MRALHRLLLTLVSLGMVVLIAGCGGGSGGGLYGASGGNTPGTTTTSAGPLVKTASATVGGASETILTNAQGMTLYYFDPDTASTIACTGSCAQLWPPLLEGDNSSLQAPAGVTGTISVLNGTNGKQVEYNGHPLYTYTGDSAPGQANGDGYNGKWHVATPSIATNGGSSGGGYNNY